MKLRCMDCIESTIFRGGPEYLAEWVLFGDSSNDYQVRILCDSHLQPYREMEGDSNLDYKRIDEGNWFGIIEEVNKTFKYLSEMYSRLLKECGKLREIEKLMRNHPRIMVNINNQYSIMPMNPSDGDKFAKEIMTILYPDEDETDD